MAIGNIEQPTAEDVVAVLCDAFQDYPVMRFVAGPQPPYPQRLAQLIGLFVAGRSLRGHPMLGLRGADGRLAAAITLTPRGDHPPPQALLTLGGSVWTRLGAAARHRYEAMIRAWSWMPQPESYWHINMLGVHPAERGQGYARALLQAACERALGDPLCRGVDLTTEDAGNLPFYRANGFDVLGQSVAEGGPVTWALAKALR